MISWKTNAQQNPPREAVGQPSKVPSCHSDPFGKTCRRAQVESLRTGSAKNLILVPGLRPGTPSYRGLCPNLPRNEIRFFGSSLRMTLLDSLVGGIFFTGMAFVSAQALLSESPPKNAPPFRVGAWTKATQTSRGMLYLFCQVLERRVPAFL